jgi:hypothetical protein
MKYILILLFSAVVKFGHAQPIIDSFPMPPLTFDAKGDMVITASPTSSANDFDFIIGKWTLKNKHLNSRLTNCKEYTEFEWNVEVSKILEGIGNIDVCRRIVDGKPWEGRTIRIFDGQSKLWRLYWVDSNSGQLDPPVVGSFQNNIGLFFCKDMWKGRPVIVVFKWDKTNPRNPRWSQAFSDDNGKTWEWNFTNTAYRITDGK